MLFGVTSEEERFQAFLSNIPHPSTGSASGAASFEPFLDNLLAAHPGKNLSARLLWRILFIAFSRRLGEACTCRIAFRSRFLSQIRVLSSSAQTAQVSKCLLTSRATSIESSSDR